MDILLLILAAAGFAFLIGGIIDNRDTAKIYDSGSSDIAIGLTAAKAIAALGDPSSIGGWVKPSFQEQTAHGPTRSVTEVRDEHGDLMKQRIENKSHDIITTFFQTTDDLYSLLEFLEKPANASPVRYPMPIILASTGEEDPDNSQWVFLYKANVVADDWRVEAINDGDRTREVTFRGTADSQGRIKEIKVLPNDTTDPAWAAFSEFIDTAFP